MRDDETGTTPVISRDQATGLPAKRWPPAPPSSTAGLGTALDPDLEPDLEIDPDPGLTADPAPDTIQETDPEIDIALDAVADARASRAADPDAADHEATSARVATAFAGLAVSPGEARRAAIRAGRPAHLPGPIRRYACRLTPVPPGPSEPLPLELVRRDIAGTRTGVPLMLRIRVVDSADCRPVTGVVLEVRHCDPAGTLDEETYLRGAQVTDGEGYAEFRTVHPGWHPGRAVHVRSDVHVGSGYLAGGRAISHTGRLYFPDMLTTEVAALPPYRHIATARTRYDEDISRATGGVLHVVPRDRFDLMSGLLAAITVAVDAKPGR
ncbi:MULTISPECIES: hypothetical protein [Actinoplanes]|uniref:hypothetical protein n=1 Tax=Actinoplanes TaxID=1865 RepID=UPI0006986CFF|nr:MULTISPECIES: hypothetical protein [Actinoplanes]GLY00191.1 hypothetical protein Acsp01_05700 [Actinoplanes sp. NBRC 101535]